MYQDSGFVNYRNAADCAIEIERLASIVDWLATFVVANDVEAARHELGFHCHPRMRRRSDAISLTVQVSHP
jgi:hypothetical protein